MRLVYHNEVAAIRREKRVQELLERHGIHPAVRDPERQAQVEAEVDGEMRTEVQMQRIAHGLELPPAGEAADLPAGHGTGLGGGLPDWLDYDMSGEAGALRGPAFVWDEEAERRETKETG